MNLVLIGYRGTGKSTVAKQVAQRLGWNVVSTDAEIVRREKRPIPDIVADRGWDYFRDVEAAVCADMGARTRMVIDTGGGAILRDANVQALKRDGRLVWLTASVPTIVGRIGGDTNRPSLTGTKSFTEEVQEVLTQREPLYRAAADATVATDGRTIEAIVTDVLRLVPDDAG
ncbi:MAG: shikimate kinase [Nitrospiraceae bacterium]